MFIKTTLSAACAVFLFATTLCGAETQPHPQAHAHNDYYHSRPLLDAIDQGFCSVEADIFLVKDRLLVAHSRNELSEEKTLERLYLDPLKKLCEANSGRVFAGGPRVTLLIDIKSSGLATYKRLHEILRRYQSILTTFNNGKTTERGVTVVISGNRPQEYLAQQSIRYAAIDGRLTDLDSKKPNHLMPLISDRWTSHFKWRGQGKFSADERQKLRGFVNKAHASGRQIRFWATADVRPMWQELYDANVDFINTDDLVGLNSFLTEQKK